MGLYYKTFQEKSIVLIDEIDFLVTRAFDIRNEQELSECLQFIIDFYRSILKGSKYFHKGYITGLLNLD